eukprot:11340264-Karenia_brevis.AAC.1
MIRDSLAGVPVGANGILDSLPGIPMAPIEDGQVDAGDIEFEAGEDAILNHGSFQILNGIEDHEGQSTDDDAEDEQFQESVGVQIHGPPVAAVVQ